MNKVWQVAHSAERRTSAEHGLEAGVMTHGHREGILVRPEDLGLLRDVESSTTRQGLPEFLCRDPVTHLHDTPSSARWDALSGASRSFLEFSSENVRADMGRGSACTLQRSQPS